MKLLCVPYAGGSARIYHPWIALLAPKLDIIPVELAGRGKRIHEPPYATTEQAVSDVYEKIKAQLDGGPYALFGHSLGAMLVFEAAKRLNRDPLGLPVHLFLSGRAGPITLRPEGKKYHLMNDEEFKAAVLALGGTPAEIFEHPQLADIFLPLLRNDFRISETESIAELQTPLETNLSVLLGTQDSSTVNKKEEWSRNIAGSCTIHQLPGGHFFINEQASLVMQIIRDTINRDYGQAVKHN